MVDVRDNALSAFEEVGLPTRKLEAWRYSPLKADLLELPLADATEVEVAPNTVVIAGGKPFIAAELPQGVSVKTQADNNAALYSPKRHPMANLNTARVGDALLINVADNIHVEDVLNIHFQDAAGTQSFSRIVIRVGKNASLRVLEHNVSNDALTNSVTEIWLDDGACLKHRNLVDHASKHLQACFVHQGKDSRFEQFSLVTSRGFTRFDLEIDLQGSGAENDLTGAYLLTDKSHFDLHVRVEHNASHTTSSVNYRGLLDDNATGVFHAAAVASKDKKQIEAHQQNHNLLMSSSAKINTQPVLQIDTDDIACSHGATVGQLDEDAVFYAQSRGIREEAARAMLTQSFLSGQADCIEDQIIRKRFKCALCDAMKAHFGDAHDCGI